MEDNLSKFGTLILTKKQTIDLEPDMTKAVQIGRSVISFTVKEMPREQIQQSIQPQVEPKSEAKVENSSPPSRPTRPPRMQNPTYDQEADRIEDVSPENIEAILKEKIEMTNHKIQ